MINSRRGERKMARLNENENENESSGDNRDGLFSGSRYNTYKIAKQVFDWGQSEEKPHAKELPGYKTIGPWDAENRAWVFLAEFMALEPDWFNKLSALARSRWPGWFNSEENSFRIRSATDGVPEMTELEFAVRKIIDASGEREDRFAEILHQRDAAGTIAYWTGMLGIDPGKHPNTYQLIRVGRKLGEMIVMCLKSHFNAERPSQLSPAIVPMFDPPQTAAYPAGHSLQPYLIAYLLRRVMPGLPNSDPPKDWEAKHTGIFALARRIADNRVIAGVHFEIDCEVGFLLAKEIDRWFDGWLSAATDEGKAKIKNFLESINAAKQHEFPQYK